MKKIILAVILMMSLALVSCKAFKQYEDTNGKDNYSLQSITEEEIIKNNSCLKVGAVSSKSTKNGVTSITESVFTFDGVEKIHSLKAGSYTITVDYTIQNGNGRFVITNGSKIIHDFVINETNQVFELDSSEPCYLKLVGENCELEIKVEIKTK